MNRIITFPGSAIEGLDRLCVAMLHAEIDEAGNVLRELGFGPTGDLVHRHPGEPTVAKYGLFDDQTVMAAACASDIPVDQFEELWRAGAQFR